MKIKILWIDDGALTELHTFTAVIYINPKYDLDIALNASEAVDMLNRKKYDVIIVDIRISPGNDPLWRNYYQKSGDNKAKAKLGIQLLYSLLKPEISNVKIENKFDWININKIGVLTIETSNENSTDLSALGITNFLEKEKSLNSNALLDFIEKIVKDNN